jgi:hypothetical protein
VSKNNNTKNCSNGRSSVVSEALYLECIGRDFVKSALLLYETKEQTREWSDYLYAFNLLASQALEILPKSIIAVRICLEKNCKPIEEIRCSIKKELGCLGHKLDNIFNEVPELKKALNISNIERFNDTGFVDEFIFTINESGKEKKICIKNLEGARYGAFANKKNYSADYNKNTVDFLKNFMEKAGEIRVDIIEKFDKK